MSPDMLKAQRHMLSTNVLEATHLTTLRVTPKNVLHRRTYGSRCYSGVLYHTLGPEEAALQTGEELGYGFSEQAQRQLASLSRRIKYHHMRQQTMAFKQARYASAQAKVRVQNLRRVGLE